MREAGGKLERVLVVGGALFALVALAPARVAAGGGEIEELARELRAERPDARRRAVTKLAALDERASWELVIEALDDPSAEVADEAQFRLAALSDERLLRALYDREGLRAGDEWRRRRVAEAFGRMDAPVDGERLLRAVARVDLGTSAAALWSAERLAARGLLAGREDRLRRELESTLARAWPGELAAAGLCALAAFDAEAAREQLSDAARDPRAELRGAAATLARLLEEEAALALLRPLARDESPSVRALALEALAELGTRAALELLIERLEAEERPRAKWRALELLQQLSGRKDRMDTRPWRHWLAGLPPDWRATRGARADASSLGSGTVALAGLRVLSDRVAILVDFSGSLWYERDEGRRKEKVDEKLRACLPALPEGTEFNLVPYTAEPHPWMDRLVPADAANVKSALRYVERCQERGSGNFYDAALWALQDPRVDTILVLTDGVPTGGRRWKLELMMPLLVNATRFRRVAFDSIVVDAPPRVRKHWSWLADATGGRSVSVDI